MISIISNTFDPYFNLATEEYLLKNKDEDIFYLYRNKPSIIVGIHQNTISEINYDYVNDNNIPVVRRLSGGGAVFHDLGNLNFCFITKSTTTSKEGFKEFTKPILEVLNKLGVNAEFSGRNDLTIDGKKFSGNAQHFYKDKVLHHGTLLFSANMTDLTAALKSKPIKFKDKSVKSVRSRVTNISSHLPTPMTIDDFVEHIINYIIGKEHKAFYKLTEDEIKEIQKLVDDKYNTWDWVYGKSPKYDFYQIIKYSGGTLEFHLDVKKGIIKDIKIYGDFFNRKNTKEIEKMLLGVKHDKDIIKNILSDVPLDEYFIGIDVDTFLSGMF